MHTTTTTTATIRQQQQQEKQKKQRHQKYTIAAPATIVTHTAGERIMKNTLDASDCIFKIIGSHATMATIHFNWLLSRRHRHLAV